MGDKKLEEDYKLHTTEFGYSVYDENEKPIITHSARPIMHSTDESVGNMQVESVNDCVKQAVYLLLKVNQADSEERSKALYSVYRSISENEMSEVDKEITKLVYNNSSLSDGNCVPEMDKFKHWLILSCDPVKVMEYKFAGKSLEKYLNLEGSK